MKNSSPGEVFRESQFDKLEFISAYLTVWVMYVLVNNLFKTFCECILIFRDDNIRFSSICFITTSISI